MTFRFDHIREPTVQGGTVLKVLTSGFCFSVKLFISVDQSSGGLTRTSQGLRHPASDAESQRHRAGQEGKTNVRKGQVGAWGFSWIHP